MKIEIMRQTGIKAVSEGVVLNKGHYDLHMRMTFLTFNNAVPQCQFNLVLLQNLLMLLKYLLHSKNTTLSSTYESNKQMQKYVEI